MELRKDLIPLSKGAIPSKDIRSLRVWSRSGRGVSTPSEEGSGLITESESGSGLADVVVKSKDRN